MTPPSELSATWSRITGALQTIMSPEVYGLWFPKFSLLEDSGKALTLVCDDPMAAPLGGKQLYAGAEAGRHAGSGHGTPDKVHLHG